MTWALDLDAADAPACGPLRDEPGRRRAQGGAEGIDGLLGVEAQGVGRGLAVEQQRQEVEVDLPEGAMAAPFAA